MACPSPIVFDLFGVLIRKQRSPDQDRLAELAGADSTGFSAAYWQERPNYDRGCSPGAYWSAVGASLGLSFNQGKVEQLTALDNESWSNVDPSMVRMLYELRRCDTPLYLLSNIPDPLFTFLDARHGWLAELFEQRFMSCEMGVAKPEIAAFDKAFSSVAQRHPGAVARFVDDSLSNIAAARGLSIVSHRYQGPAALQAWLRDSDEAQE